MFIPAFKKEKVKAIVTDVDGILTENRRNFKLYLPAVRALRIISRKIPIVLISANAYQVLAGLAKYLGIRGPVVAENGCIVFYKNKVYSVSRYSTRDIANDVLNKFRTYLKPSWQNNFRMYDFALKVKRNYIKKFDYIVELVKEYVNAQYGKYCYVQQTFRTIFLTPIDGGKARGMQKALEFIGINPDQVLGIGDGINDIDFLKISGLKATVANADKEVKEVVDYVSPYPSGRGFIDIVRRLFMQ